MNDNRFEGHNFCGPSYYANKCACTACFEYRTHLHAVVARGAAFLDEAIPNWWEKVDVKTLDVDMHPSPAQRYQGVVHLLVQVLGSPEVTKLLDAMNILGLSIEDAKYYGFWDARHTRIALNYKWVEVVLRRSVESVEI